MNKSRRKLLSKILKILEEIIKLEQKACDNKPENIKHSNHSWIIQEGVHELEEASELIEGVIDA